VTVTRNGQTVDAVAQITKTGYVYVLERKTGKPLFDVKERQVLASNVEARFVAHAALSRKTSPFTSRRSART